MNPDISLTRDWELVWAISQHPAVVDHIINDEWAAEALDVRKMQVRLLVLNPANYVLLVKDLDAEGAAAGCFLLDNRGEGVFEVHTMLLPACRGALGIVAGRMGIRFALALPGVEKLISKCPMNHREILFYALKCGFHKAGEAAMSWLKAGILYPLQTVELSRKDLEPCH